ncbi:DAK2 domain-containing protein [Halobacillus karajensis]|uniref:Dihydroxyacetone kinase n=1 Tax=Halobacillus karajensis TaxID=195088 RepID=A0A024P2G3_9BACI|nr:DAK2 domain-containing protein [Halobacillus karajensis]CDQ19793.1 dihydroxyacetone kinase [Halobacillus karajensis]CDQ22253.1 dihydroxyacetone kinase [Halobacillus karajensis]CDQ28094.1 dihydroxyacetone kinase [Halobacillus karajensis]
MTLQKLDGKTLAEMILQGAQHLKQNSQMIDALNVFPVPDGDTGTNMNLSMTSGAEEVRSVDKNHAGTVSKSLSKGLLMGARGNSGVILSQIFRGFSKAVEEKEVLTTKDFAEGLQGGVTTAYKAVMKPVEGTILTVAREAAEASVEIAENEPDFLPFMEGVVKAAKESLKGTPELLPVLKEVGVVDSGGQGLVTIYEGFLANLKGEELPDLEETVSMDDMVNAEHHKLNQDFMNTEDIEFGYCTEFMVKFEEEKLAENPYDEEAFRRDLSQIGDSLLVVSDEELIKVHVHAEYPGEAMTLGQKYGSLVNMKIENMREQHTSIVGEKKKAKPQSQKKAEYGIVTVSMGDGIKKLFESLGATVVIQGGQTMNPSTQDLSEAIKEASAKRVLVLPNNKNIVMAAEQAAEIADVEVAVIPSKTIPQGMSAMLGFNPEADIETNKQEMGSLMAEVKTGQITYAVRDTQIDGLNIEKDHFMGIADGKISVTDKDVLTTAKTLLNQMIDEDEDEILTILTGEEVDEKEVADLEAYMEENFEDVEVEIHNGGQPIYSYIFSIE